MLVQLYRAIPEPQNVERATSMALTLFLLIRVNEGVRRRYKDMYQKVCIFVKGTSSRGKTKTIVSLANLLGIESFNQVHVAKGEYIGTANVENGKVSLHSDGRPNGNSVDWIRNIAIQQESSDVIVAACRRGGKTQDTLLPDLYANGYEVIEAYPLRKPTGIYSQQETECFSDMLAHLIYELVKQVLCK